MPLVEHATPVDPTSQRRIQKILSDPESTGTVLLVILMDLYGAEATAWSPQAILLEFEDDFKVKLPSNNLDKLMATIQIITSDEFYTNLPTFNEFCVILADGPHQPGVFVPADARSCAWGMSEVLLLDPPEQDEPFSPEIVSFLSKAISDEGILKPPDVLRIATHDPQLMDRIRYDYADDEEMFTGIYKAEKEKTDEINTYVRDRLRKMLMTLESLPLTQGDARQISQKLMNQLPAQGQSNG